MASKAAEGKGKGKEAQAPPVRRPGVTVAPTVLALGAAAVLMLGFAGGYIVATNVGPDRGAGQAAGPGPQTQINPELAILGERLKRDPNDVEALLRLAHVHLDQGQNDAAKAMYQRVLQIDPRNAEAVTHLGNVILAEGRADEALRRYDEALAIDPKYLHALWDKATLLQQTKGTPAAAVPVWEAVLKVVPPGSPDALKAQEMLAAARQGRAGGPAGPADAVTVPRQPAVEPASLKDPVAQGRVLYEKWGCPRCHVLAGRGGTIGPDLTRIGAKPGRDAAWHIRHFKDPATVVPGSVMPPLAGAPEAELRALAEYMVSLK